MEKPDETWTYILTFRNQGQLPDIGSQPDLAKVLAVKSQRKDGYLVASRVNDKQLQKLICQAYQLDLSEVSVASTYPVVL